MGAHAIANSLPAIYLPQGHVVLSAMIFSPEWFHCMRRAPHARLRFV
jgi:hypothetical protein